MDLFDKYMNVFCWKLFLLLVMSYLSGLVVLNRARLVEDRDLQRLENLLHTHELPLGVLLLFLLGFTALRGSSMFGLVRVLVFRSTVWTDITRLHLLEDLVLVLCVVVLIIGFFCFHLFIINICKNSLSRF
jgi:hypothetical protein